MRPSELADKFLVDRAAYRGYSRRTVEVYALTFRQFCGYLQSIGLNDDVRNFTPETCEGFAQHLIRNGRKGSTTGTRLSALTSLASYGQKTRDQRGRYVLADNPMLRIERPRRQPVSRSFLYKDELRAFARVELPANEHIARDLILATVLRVEELCDLKVEDVYEDGAGRLCLSTAVKGRKTQRTSIALPSEGGAALASRASPPDRTSSGTP